MSTSRNSGHSNGGTSFTAPLDGLPTLSRYDVLLVLIALGFVLSVAAYLVLDVALHQAAVVVAVLGSFSLADALFLHPPVEGRR
ncbi:MULTISPECIES: hypothetical protein [Salinibaculum]|uniref:hypothetical protein n=1 Tax=Salinibaculum TaxID=2732368 RepID=UPI0030CF4210